MPEVGTEFVSKTVAGLALPWMADDQVKSIVEENNEDFIGCGAESIVVSRKGRPEQVVAFDYGKISPLKAKQIFYLHRIFSTLFPHNFPHFSASFGRESPGTIRQRIASVKNKDQEVQYPFAEVVEECYQQGIPFHLDTTSCNFAIGIDGGEYYLDRLIPEGQWSWDREKVAGFMREKGFSERDQRMVELSIRRFRELKRQEIASVTPKK